MAAGCADSSKPGEKLIKLTNNHPHPGFLLFTSGQGHHTETRLLWCALIIQMYPYANDPSIGLSWSCSTKSRRLITIKLDKVTNCYHHEVLKPRSFRGIRNIISTTFNPYHIRAHQNVQQEWIKWQRLSFTSFWGPLYQRHCWVLWNRLPDAVGDIEPKPRLWLR